MQSALRELWALQQIDTEIHEIERAIAKLDTGARARQVRDRAKANRDAAAATLRKVETEIRDVELNIRSAETKSRDIEARMYSGKVISPKELESMRKETDMHGRNRDKLETRELELMEEQTAAKQAAATAEAVQAKAEELLKETLALYGAEKARLDALMAEAQPRREAQAARASAEDASLVRKYENLRQKLANQAVAKIEAASCGACKVAISSTVVKDVRGGEVVTCDSCGRILFVEE